MPYDDPKGKLAVLKAIGVVISTLLLAGLSYFFTAFTASWGIFATLMLVLLIAIYLTAETIFIWIIESPIYLIRYLRKSAMGQSNTSDPNYVSKIRKKEPPIAKWLNVGGIIVGMALATYHYADFWKTEKVEPPTVKSAISEWLKSRND